MADIRKIIEFIYNYLEATGKSYTTPIEINPLLESAGLLNDSLLRSGKPLRDKLRSGLIPHAYQLGGKGGRWNIPYSSAKFKLN